MKILLDTHILLWILTGDYRLSRKTKEIVSELRNTCYYSILSVWEVELKHLAHPNKLDLNGRKLAEYCKEAGFYQLPLKESHIFELENLTRSDNVPKHKNPFDRLLLCQAISEDFTFLTHDSRLDEYQVNNILIV